MSKNVSYDQLFYDQPTQPNVSVDKIIQTLKQKLSKVSDDSDSLLDQLKDIYTDTNNSNLE